MTKFYRVIITKHDTGYVGVGSAYPKREGEDHECGNDILDGRGPEVWAKLRSLLAYLEDDSDHTPEGWKRHRINTLPEPVAGHMAAPLADAAAYGLGADLSGVADAMTERDDLADALRTRVQPLSKAPRYEYQSRIEHVDQAEPVGQVEVYSFAGRDGWELVSVVPFTRMENTAPDGTLQSFGMTSYCRLFFKRMVP